MISLLKIYIELNFDVLHAASNDRYADNNTDKKLVNLGLIVSFRNYKLTTCSGKHLEDIAHAHIASLIYNLIISARDTDDLSIGFDRDRNREQREIITNKIITGKYHNRFYLKGVFGFAGHQEKATFALSYKLTLTRKNDNSVLNKDTATSIGKIEINATEWYVQHYTPSIPQQAL